jgi:hypothetical protein
VIATFLTVLAAGALGGGVAADLTVLIIIAAVALVLLGTINGLRNLVRLCELRRD